MKKTLPLALFETSLLMQSGVPLVDGWEAVAQAYADDVEAASLFKALIEDWNTGAPSVAPYENSGLPEDDVRIMKYYAELAVATTMYDAFWHDMAVAFALKQKVQGGVPTEADIAVANYLIRDDLSVAGMPLKDEVMKWSSAEAWQAIHPAESQEFPAAWWRSLGVSEGELLVPRTIAEMLNAYIQSGNLDHLPDLLAKWTRFSQAADAIFGK